MTALTLGSLLKDEGLIKAAELEFALSLQQTRSGVRLGYILLEYNLVSPQILGQALARLSGWPFFDGDFIPNQAVCKEWGLHFLIDRVVFPLLVPGRVCFVLADGEDTFLVDKLRTRYGAELLLYVAPEGLIRKANRQLLPVNNDQIENESESLVMNADSLLREASQQGASDIHLEAGIEVGHIRFRVDGVLHHYRSFPLNDLARLINIFFSKAGISAGDYLRIHDGRFTEILEGRSLDVRLSCLPSAGGPSLVLRLLDRTRTVLSLEHLGYAESIRLQIRQALRRPNGLILFCGPTGCGKSTALYSLLNDVRGLGNKALSVEDPVEVRMPLVIQVPVDAQREQDFHQVVRAMLRHDPDVIMIGEIRDEKTAREALRAAVTGHRVLATLHTNDATSALLRLRDLGIDEHQLSVTLNAVVAQRLVRKLCRYCRREQEGVYRAEGCDHCREGYHGRTVVAEVLLLNEKARLALSSGRLADAQQLCWSGMANASMRRDAERLLKEGITSIEEIERVMG